jgi:YD repeat-containing protein
MMLMELGPGFSQNIYDDAGQLKSSIDLRGQTTTYQYDALGRQKAVTLPDPDGPVGAGISPQTDFFYDKVGNILQERVRLTTAPSYLITNHAYDRLNRRTSTTDANGANQLAEKGSELF